MVFFFFFFLFRFVLFWFCFVLFCQLLLLCFLVLVQSGVQEADMFSVRKPRTMEDSPKTHLENLVGLICFLNQLWVCGPSVYRKEDCLRRPFLFGFVFMGTVFWVCPLHFIYGFCPIVSVLFPCVFCLWFFSCV